MMHSLKYPFNVSFDCLFNRLVKLEDVNIQKNFFRAYVPYPVSIFSRILSKLPDSVKTLNIDIPEVSNFASFLMNFTNLTSLGISAKENFKICITNGRYIQIVEKFANTEVQILQ